MDQLADFDFYLRFTKPLILNLPKINDRILASAWVVKLLQSKDCDEKTKVDYLKLLLFVLQRKTLITPFDQHPNNVEEIKPLPEDKTLVQAAREMIVQESLQRRDQQQKKRLGQSGDFPAYISDFSADLLEYAAVQTIENFGIHGYYAISKQPLNNWYRVDKQVLPKAAKSMLEMTSGPNTIMGALSTPVVGKSPAQSPPRSPPPEPEVPPAEEPPAEAAEGEAAPAPAEETPKKRRKSRKSTFGASAPSEPIGKVSRAPQERSPPTWGSNLLEVKKVLDDDVSSASPADTEVLWSAGETPGGGASAASIPTHKTAKKPPQKKRKPGWKKPPPKKQVSEESIPEPEPEPEVPDTQGTEDEFDEGVLTAADLAEITLAGLNLDMDFDEGTDEVPESDELFAQMDQEIGQELNMLTCLEEQQDTEDADEQEAAAQAAQEAEKRVRGPGSSQLQSQPRFPCGHDSPYDVADNIHASPEAKEIMKEAAKAYAADKGKKGRKFNIKSLKPPKGYTPHVKGKGSKCSVASKASATSAASGTSCAPSASGTSVSSKASKGSMVGKRKMTRRQPGQSASQSSCASRTSQASAASAAPPPCPAPAPPCAAPAPPCQPQAQAGFVTPPRRRVDLQPQEHYWEFDCLTQPRTTERPLTPPPPEYRKDYRLEKEKQQRDRERMEAEEKIRTEKKSKAAAKAAEKKALAALPMWKRIAMAKEKEELDRKRGIEEEKKRQKELREKSKKYGRIAPKKKKEMQKEKKPICGKLQQAASRLSTKRERRPPRLSKKEKEELAKAEAEKEKKAKVKVLKAQKLPRKGAKGKKGEPCAPPKEPTPPPCGPPPESPEDGPLSPMFEREPDKYAYLDEEQPNYGYYQRPEFEVDSSPESPGYAYTEGYEYATELASKVPPPYPPSGLSPQRTDEEAYQYGLQLINQKAKIALGLDVTPEKFELTRRLETPSPPPTPPSFCTPPYVPPPPPVYKPREHSPDEQVFPHLFQREINMFSEGVDQAPFFDRDTYRVGSRRIPTKFKPNLDDAFYEAQELLCPEDRAIQQEICNFPKMPNRFENFVKKESEPLTPKRKRKRAPADIYDIREAEIERSPPTPPTPTPPHLRGNKLAWHQFLDQYDPEIGTPIGTDDFSYDPCLEEMDEQLDMMHGIAAAVPCDQLPRANQLAYQQRPLGIREPRKRPPCAGIYNIPERLESPAEYVDLMQEMMVPTRHSRQERPWTPPARRMPSAEEPCSPMMERQFAPQMLQPVGEDEMLQMQYYGPEDDPDRDMEEPHTVMTTSGEICADDIVDHRSPDEGGVRVEQVSVELSPLCESPEMEAMKLRTAVSEKTKPVKYQRKYSGIIGPQRYMPIKEKKLAERRHEIHGEVMKEVDRELAYDFSDVSYGILDQPVCQGGLSPPMAPVPDVDLGWETPPELKRPKPARREVVVPEGYRPRWTNSRTREEIDEIARIQRAIMGVDLDALSPESRQIKLRKIRDAERVRTKALQKLRGQYEDEKNLGMIDRNYNDDSLEDFERMERMMDESDDEREELDEFEEMERMMQEECQREQEGQLQFDPNLIERVFDGGFDEPQVMGFDDFAQEAADISANLFDSSDFQAECLDETPPIWHEDALQAGPEYSPPSCLYDWAPNEARRQDIYKLTKASRKLQAETAAMEMPTVIDWDQVYDQEASRRNMQQIQTCERGIEDLAYEQDQCRKEMIKIQKQGVAMQQEHHLAMKRAECARRNAMEVRQFQEEQARLAQGRRELRARQDAEMAAIGPPSCGGTPNWTPPPYVPPTPSPVAPPPPTAAPCQPKRKSKPMRRAGAPSCAPGQERAQEAAPVRCLPGKNEAQTMALRRLAAKKSSTSQKMPCKKPSTELTAAEKRAAMEAEARAKVAAKKEEAWRARQKRMPKEPPSGKPCGRQPPKALQHVQSRLQTRGPPCAAPPQQAPSCSSIASGASKTSRTSRGSTRGTAPCKPTPNYKNVQSKLSTRRDKGAAPCPPRQTASGASVASTRSTRSARSGTAVCPPKRPMPNYQNVQSRLSTRRPPAAAGAPCPPKQTASGASVASRGTAAAPRPGTRARGFARSGKALPAKKSLFPQAGGYGQPPQRQPCAAASSASVASAVSNVCAGQETPKTGIPRGIPRRLGAAPPGQRMLRPPQASYRTPQAAPSPQRRPPSPCAPSPQRQQQQYAPSPPQRSPSPCAPSPQQQQQQYAPSPPQRSPSPCAPSPQQQQQQYASSPPRSPSPCPPPQQRSPSPPPRQRSPSPCPPSPCASSPDDTKYYSAVSPEDTGFDPDALAELGLCADDLKDINMDDYDNLNVSEVGSSIATSCEDEERRVKDEYDQHMAEYDAMLDEMMEGCEDIDMDADYGNIDYGAVSDNEEICDYE